MKNIFEAFKRKKAAALMSVAFLCVIGSIIYTISKPVPNQHDESSSSSAPTSSSVKVKVADISPTNSTASSTVSSKAPAQKVGLGETVSEGVENYKPVTGQPQKQTPGNSSRSSDTPSVNSTNNTITGIAVPDHISLTVGEGLPISTEITPETALDKKVIWKSSDENIAKVDKTGMVTGAAAGSCTVTVQAASGKAKSSISVTVMTTNN